MAGSERDEQLVQGHAQVSIALEIAALRHALESIEVLAAQRRSGAMGQILAIATHALQGTEG